ncbi:hypothetical protein JCM17960_20180 [Magnetospira thiophila]
MGQTQPGFRCYTVPQRAHRPIQIAGGGAGDPQMHEQQGIVAAQVAALVQMLKATVRVSLGDRNKPQYMPGTCVSRRDRENLSA